MIEYAGEYGEIKRTLAEPLNHVRDIEFRMVLDFILVPENLLSQPKLATVKEIGGDDRCGAHTFQDESHQPVHGADINHTLSLRVDVLKEGVNAEESKVLRHGFRDSTLDR